MQPFNSTDCLFHNVKLYMYSLLQCQGGCLMELCIQLAIIFVGKMLIQNNLMEILMPYVHLLSAIPKSVDNIKSLYNICVAVYILEIQHLLIQLMYWWLILGEYVCFRRIKKFVKERCFSTDNGVDKASLKPWEKDINLEDLGYRGLFSEYLEMCK